MVDRVGRDRLAKALQDLINGDITADAFVSCNPEGRSRDRALYPIWLYGCSLFHDIYPYRLRGRHVLQPEERIIVKRCIDFLNTDLEYGWPPYPEGLPFAYAFICGVLINGVAVILAKQLPPFVTWSLFLLGCLLMLSMRVFHAIWERRQLASFWTVGEKALWPFLNQDDLDNTRKTQ